MNEAQQFIFRLGNEALDRAEANLNKALAILDGFREQEAIDAIEHDENA